MKAEAALRGSQRHVKEVKEELSEVKEDLVDTVSRLKVLVAGSLCSTLSA